MTPYQPSGRHHHRPVGLIVVALLVAALLTPAAAIAGSSAGPETAPPAPASHGLCPAPDFAGPPSDGSGSISGRVVDGTGTGVAGIRIRAFTSANHGAATFSTADGSFALVGIEEVPHVLSFYDANGAVQNGFLGAVGLVIDRVDAAPIDAGANVALPTLVLPDEHISVVSGRVTDSDGVGVADAVLRASSPYFPVQGCGTTDADGYYTMPDVHTGLYIVSVAPGFAGPSGFYVEGSISFSTHFADATRLAITADLSGVDIQLPVTYTLTGTVTTAGGDPVEGISISACEVDEDGLCAHGSSDADGSFSVAPLVAGDYVIHQADHTQSSMTGYHVVGGVVADRGDAAVYTITDDSTVLILRAVPTARLQGVVRNALADPLEGISVSACEVTSFECSDGVTDGAGAYALGANPGTYVVRFDDPSGAHPGGYYGPADGGDPVQLVEAEADARLITVGTTDVPLEPITLPDGARISGIVTTDGEPVAFVGVDVCPSESECVANGATDDFGAFTTAAVRPGTYLLGGTDSEGGRAWYVAGGAASADVGDATQIVVTTTDITGVVFEIPVVDAAVETPEGEDVEVIGPIDPNTGEIAVTLTFDEVDVAGATTFTPADSSPYDTAGFQVGVPATYYEISTTATFSGLVTICLSYAGVSFPSEAGLRLYHYDEVAEAWEDTTFSQDLDADIICGRTDSFSPFVIGLPTAAFGGFEAPVDDLPVRNQAKAGSGIPVNFDLGGDFGLDVLATGSPSSAPADCSSGEGTDAIESTSSAGTSSLSYSPASALYTYVWKTKKEWANTCRLLTLTLDDGTTQSALFIFKK